MATIKDETPPASARRLGAVVRKTLKALGLDWKVKSSLVSFAGLGYGSMPFAEIATERKLTYVESSALADALRALRVDPDGGKGVVQLAGKDYAFGGSISHKDYPSGADFWRQAEKDLRAEPIVNTPVIREAERRVLIAYDTEKPAISKDLWCEAWLIGGFESPEVWGLGWPDIYAPGEQPQPSSACENHQPRPTL